MGAGSVDACTRTLCTAQHACVAKVALPTVPVVLWRVIFARACPARLADRLRQDMAGVAWRLNTAQLRQAQRVGAGKHLGDLTYHTHQRQAWVGQTLAQVHMVCRAPVLNRGRCGGHVLTEFCPAHCPYIHGANKTHMARRPFGQVGNRCTILYIILLKLASGSGMQVGANELSGHAHGWQEWQTIARPGCCAGWDGRRQGEGPWA